MTSRTARYVASIASLGLISCGAPAPVAPSIPAEPAAPESAQVLSMLNLMTTVITPATNTLWGVESPASDQDWQQLEEAARTTLAASTQVQQGATGEREAAWAEDPLWQQYAADMITAASAALLAARTRNLDALLQANETLLPPCEDCHLKFNPAVVQETPPN